MSAAVHEPFALPEQQRRAAMLGMTIFLSTEILLFGGVFAAITYYRVSHHALAVEASKELHLWIGAANTVVLLASSFTAAVAVAAAKLGRSAATAGLLIVTALLGTVFLVLKAVEYGVEYQDGMLPVRGGDGSLTKPITRLFMNLYLIATSLHAIHLTIGILLLAGLAARVWTRSVSLPSRTISVEVPVLYWHLVDVIWVFLYPALYLIR